MDTESYRKLGRNQLRIGVPRGRPRGRGRAHRCIEYVVERLALVQHRADEHRKDEQPEHGRQQPAGQPVHGFSVLVMRLFVGLAPSAEALDHLDAACAPLRPGRGDLRWTSRELWHIALAFLGEVSEERLAGLLPRLERAARRHLAFGLNLAGAGAFPTPTRANVLWGGLSRDRKALGHLAMSVGAGARRAGAPPLTRAALPAARHLARCRMPADVRELVAELSGYQGPPGRPGRSTSSAARDLAARSGTKALGIVFKLKPG